MLVKNYILFLFFYLFFSQVYIIKQQQQQRKHLIYSWILVWNEYIAKGAKPYQCVSLWCVSVNMFSLAVLIINKQKKVLKLLLTICHITRGKVGQICNILINKTVYKYTDTQKCSHRVIKINPIYVSIETVEKTNRAVGDGLFVVL